MTDRANLYQCKLFLSPFFFQKEVFVDDYERLQVGGVCKARALRSGDLAGQKESRPARFLFFSFSVNHATALTHQPA
jgi:hypothetical protein